MPIYEYRCQSCQKIMTAFLASFQEPEPVTCSHCGKSSLKRLVSRFSAVRSEESRMEDFADPSNFANVDEKDPRSLARFMKKMGKEMGEDLPEDFDEMAEKAAETGKFPDMAESSASDSLNRE